jgi:hypothetical protein
MTAASFLAGTSTVTSARSVPSHGSSGSSRSCVLHGRHGNSNKANHSKGAHGGQEFHFRAKQSIFLRLGVFRFAVLRIKIPAKDKNARQSRHKESDTEP